MLTDTDTIGYPLPGNVRSPINIRRPTFPIFRQTACLLYYDVKPQVIGHLRSAAGLSYTPSSHDEAFQKAPSRLRYTALFKLY